MKLEHFPSNNDKALSILPAVLSCIQYMQCTSVLAEYVAYSICSTVLYQRNMQHIQYMQYAFVLAEYTAYSIFSILLNMRNVQHIVCSVYFCIRGIYNMQYIQRIYRPISVSEIQSISVYSLYMQNTVNFEYTYINAK